MKISFAKIIIKERKKYIVPRRYSSFTCCAVYEDGKMFGRVQVSNYGGFKKTVAKLKERYLKKYWDAEFEVDYKPVTIYQDQ